MNPNQVSIASDLNSVRTEMIHKGNYYKWLAPVDSTIIWLLEFLDILAKRNGGKIPEDIPEEKSIPSR